MAVLVNNSTGLAEDLGADLAQQAVGANTHSVPLNDPQGNPVTVSHEQASELVSQGYTQPTTEQLSNLLDYSKYSSPAQQAKTFAEGAGEAATFGASAGIERMLGVKPEDINKRAEINPGAKAAGEVTGLIGSSFIPVVGEANLLTRAAERIVPYAAESFVGRVGTAAAKASIENMMFQGGDEASKLFSSDPNQSVETAVTDIGLSGLLGATLGGTLKGTSELWKLGPGKQLDSLLEAVKNRASGLPSELKTSADIHIPPEVESALGDNPKAQQWFQDLQESNASAGTKTREAFTKFKENVNQGLLDAVGKTPEQIEDLSNLSQHDVGTKLKEDLTTELKRIVAPISEKYDKFENTFKNAVVSPEMHSEASAKLAQLGADENLWKLPSKEPQELLNKVQEQLQHQSTANDLKIYMTALKNDNPFGSPTYQIAKKIGNVLEDTQQAALTGHVQINAPQLLEEYAATKSDYKGVKDLIDTLNDRLHVGKSYGPGSFMKNLSEMKPIDVARRLSTSKDVDLQNLLTDRFPAIAEAVRQNELDKILKKSIGKEGLDANKLFRNIEALSPEMRQSIMSDKSMEQVGALKELLSRVPSKGNPSGTAKTLDMLWSEVPASATGIASMLMGHSGITGYILGKAASYIGREAPAATKLAMLKFLSSGEAISGEGFKAATRMASAVIKGETALNKAVKSVFSSGKDVIGMPGAKEKEALKATVRKVAENPAMLMDENNDKTGHYLPEHATAVATMTTRNLQYLASLQPHDAPAGPLDEKPIPSKSEEATYDRAVTIAQNPAVVIRDIKDGTLTAQDIQHVQTMYPAFYQNLHQKLTNELITAKSKDVTIPYKTKIALSMFMAQPLESSMSPVSIQSSQMLASAQQPMQQAKPTATGMQKLDKVAPLYQTDQQHRATARTLRH